MARTNQEVAQAVGLSDSMISRISTGSKGPSIRTILKIRDVYQWSVIDQLEALDAGTYADHFRSVVMNEDQEAAKP